MSEEEITDMQIENLIYKLNNLALQRKELHDALWVIEDEGEQLRLSLLKHMRIKSRRKQ